MIVKTAIAFPFDKVFFSKNKANNKQLSTINRVPNFVVEKSKGNVSQYNLCTVKSFLFNYDTNL